MNTPMENDEYLIERLNSDLATHGLGAQGDRTDEAQPGHHVAADDRVAHDVAVDHMAAVVPMADMARPIDEHEPEAFALRPTANDVVDPRRRHDDRPAPGYRGFGTPEQAHGATHLHAPHAASLEGSAPAKADDGGALAPAPVNALVVPAGDTISVATDARGVLDGVAHSLRTLAGRDAVDGPSVAIFPRGVDLLEVRMHISRDRDIDLNFRVAGPTPLSPSV